MEPPASKLGLLEFILYRHTLLSLCFRRSRTQHGTSVRQRLFFVTFIAGCSLAVAMKADVWMYNRSEPQPSWTSHAGKLLMVVGLTVFVVTPLHCLLKLAYTPLSSALNASAPCVSSWTGDVLRVEEVLLLIWWLRLLTFGMFDDAAADAHASLVGSVAIGAQYVAEVPSLAAQYLFARTCCSCCLPSTDDFGVV